LRSMTAATVVLGFHRFIAAHYPENWPEISAQS